MSELRKKMAEFHSNKLYTSIINIKDKTKLTPKPFGLNDNNYYYYAQRAHNE